MGLVLLLGSTVPTLENYAQWGSGLSTGHGAGSVFWEGSRVRRLDHLTAPWPATPARLGWWISRSLVGEAVICTLGYATALWIVFFLVSRYTTWTTGLVATTFGYILLARFYKWYVWLFPLACLLAWHGYLHSRHDRRWRWAVLAERWPGWNGCTASTSAPRASWLAWRWQQSGSSRLPAVDRAVRSMRHTSVGRVFPAAADLVRLAGPFRRPARLSRLLVDDTARDQRILADHGHVPADIQLARARVDRTIIVLSYAIVPLTYAVGLLIGLGAEIRGRHNSRTRILLAVAMIGLSALHQAWHRRGPSHLLQVIPPAIIGVHLLVGFFLDSPWFATAVSWPRWALRFAAFSYFALAIACVLGLAPFARSDMAEHDLWPSARYAALAPAGGIG